MEGTALENVGGFGVVNLKNHERFVVINSRSCPTMGGRHGYVVGVANVSFITIYIIYVRTILIVSKWIHDAGTVSLEQIEGSGFFFTYNR